MEKNKKILVGIILVALLLGAILIVRYAIINSSLGSDFGITGDSAPDTSDSIRYEDYQNQILETPDSENIPPFPE